MFDAIFTKEGVVLRLSSREFTFIAHALSYVLYGVRVPDFEIVMETRREDAERFVDEISARETEAKIAGSHWLVRASDERPEFHQGDS